MKFELSYPERSFLRNLVKKEQLRIWKEKWSKHFKNKSVEENEKFYNEIMNKPCEIPLTEENCCYLLLKKFQEKEDEIQSCLKSKKSRRR